MTLRVEGHDSGCRVQVNQTCVEDLGFRGGGQGCCIPKYITKTGLESNALMTAACYLGRPKEKQASMARYLAQNPEP